MLAICRDFSQPPSWWDCLSRDERARLLAWYQYQQQEGRGG